MAKVQIKIYIHGLDKSGRHLRMLARIFFGGYVEFERKAEIEVPISAFPFEKGSTFALGRKQSIYCMRFTAS